jgi:hypothetical protein
MSKTEFGSEAWQRKQDAQDWWTEDRRERYDELYELSKKAEKQYRERSEEYVTSHGLIYSHAPNPHGIGSDETPDEWCFSGSKKRIDDPDLMAEVLEDLTGKSVRWETEKWVYESYYFLFGEEQ